MVDVTDRDSILAAKKVIEDAEGVLHILVNKYIFLPRCDLLRSELDRIPSAGQVGPVYEFFNQKNAPEHADPETLGMALFNKQTSEQWAKLYEINTFSIYFVTTAFLGLLAKGGSDYSSVVINITSVSGITKLSQRHVSPHVHDYRGLTLRKLVVRVQ